MIEHTLASYGGVFAIIPNDIKGNYGEIRTIRFTETYQDMKI
jgi:hypothetical protein